MRLKHLTTDDIGGDVIEIMMHLIMSAWIPDTCVQSSAESLPIAIQKIKGYEILLELILSPSQSPSPGGGILELGSNEFLKQRPVCSTFTGHWQLSCLEGNISHLLALWIRHCLTSAEG